MSSPNELRWPGTYLEVRQFLRRQAAHQDFALHRPGAGHLAELALNRHALNNCNCCCVLVTCARKNGLRAHFAARRAKELQFRFKPMLFHIAIQRAG